jgi:hypothetical protein
VQGQLNAAAASTGGGGLNGVLLHSIRQVVATTRTFAPLKNRQGLR